jgi:tetratricopeptide (TPR) repeat protein
MGDEDHRQRLANIIYLNATKQYQEAIEKTTTLVDDLPSFAEAWYHRGSAWFQVEDFSQAIHDFHQALELNPYQFVAAAAMGDAYLRLEDPVSALDTLRRTLRLNPDLKRVQNQVAELARQVEDE